MRCVSLIFSVGVSVAIYSSVTVRLLVGWDGPTLAIEVISYPNDEYIGCYRGITLVYIGNPANHDTRSVGYHPARVNRRMMTFMLQEIDDMASVEIDDMASVVIKEPPSASSQMAIFEKKVQTIIRRHSQYNHRVVIPESTYRTGSARRVKRDARRQLGHGVGGGRPPIPPFRGRPGHADPGYFVMERGEGFGQVERGEESGGGHPPVDPFDSLNLDIPSFSLGLTQPSQSLPGGSGTLCAPPPSGLWFAPFQSPADTSLGFSSFHAPPPTGTSGSSTSHQPVHLNPVNLVNLVTEHIVSQGEQPMV
ncbi:hypothetical protein M9H77_16820 [Catharanthus roseus]|uniref:Uncharacterized protein n=1 Tax=Catharanthus roseus TaxID=4058 RepID=A0ACC0B307_CATRO|nr:hypothetical protein M9H77_16820 [Catharanthus roseus]